VRVADLPTPALLVDLDRLEANLEGMAERCRRLGVRLRPHAKTHKCVEIAHRQRDLGAVGLTVSTLAEAQVFEAAGFHDLTWALPVPLSRLAEARTLAARITLRLVVDTEEAVAALEATGFPFRTYLKVDCGYHRAGVDPGRPEAVELARRLARSRRLRFAGLLTHSGHAYRARGRAALAAVAEEERRVMAEFAARLAAEGLEVPEVSVGSTPAMSAVAHLDGVTEARPGNYAFYDRMQVGLGVCTVADCALTVLTSVVSSPAGSDHSVVDAGALALSKDPGLPFAEPPSMGEVLTDGGLDPDLRLVSLSQEHGILSRRRPLGERLRILPNHSCLAAACFDRLHVVRADSVLDVWTIHRER
jgi:D-serine deaminase-like pyridoxal phosphate-dependent protein